MEMLIKQLAGLIGSIIATGGLLTFVLALLKRRDDAVHRREDSARVYELAFRRADNWARNLAQLVGPAALSWHEGERGQMESYLEILFRFVADEDGATDRCTLKPHPDFLAEARAELNIVEGRATNG